MIKFDKVSLEEFAKNNLLEIWDKDGNKKEDVFDYKTIYNNIVLPKRATKSSAGYDIFSPIDFILHVGESIKIPLGIRCEMDENVFLMIVPRSGLGFKYKLQLYNTCGIIDSDYFYSDNEGHIFVKFKNEGFKDLQIKVGDGICQGIFLNYLTTIDDAATEIRNGGLGSTSK
jgi:dUTP pyrophosphatase